MSWRNTRDYRIWRAIVIRRDNVCQCCGDRSRRQAHHIEDGSHNPDLRFEPSNGIVLCYDCHRNLHTNYKKSYRYKTTRNDLENFVEIAKWYLNK